MRSACYRLAFPDRTGRESGSNLGRIAQIEKTWETASVGACLQAINQFQPALSPASRLLPLVIRANFVLGNSSSQDDPVSQLSHS